MKRIISSILIALLLFSPLGTVAYADTGSCAIITTGNAPACCTGISNDAACQDYYANTTSNNTTTSSPSSPSTSTGSTGNTAATNSILKQYNPNVNINSGNTYGGSSPISITGVGGAIASCLNVGSFLENGVSSLFKDLNVKTGTSTASAYVGGQQAVSTSDTGTQNQLKTINNTDNCLNGIAYAVAKNMLAQITNQTLKWVNTGLQGNPLYVQNVPSYLKTIGNQQITSYLSTVQTSDPIFGNALRSALTYQLTGKNDGLLSTPLNTPQSKAYTSFMSDFTNGGWDALLNPAYNPIGAFFNASDQLTSNVNNSQQNATNEIQRNNGFLDLKKCTQYANGTQDPTSAACSTVNSDSTYELCCTGQSSEDSATCNTYAQTVVNRDDGGDTSCLSINQNNESTCCSGVDGDGNESPMCVAYDTYSGANDTPSSATSALTAGISGNAAPCTQWSTVTPGSVIANQVNTITTSPNRQLEQANQINEVLGSFFDSFVNNLLSKGLSGTSSGSSPTLTGLGNDGTNAVAGTTDTGSDTSALGYTASSSDDVDTGDFDISRPQQLYAILQTQYNFLNATEDAQIALERVVPAVGALDYCIPGPNPDYETNLDSNWQSFISSIQQANPKDPTTAEKLLGDLPLVGGLLQGIVGLFTGSGTAPDLWGATAALTDKVTGESIQINRTFYTPSGHTSDAINTSDLTNSLQNAYAAMISQYAYFYTGLNPSDDTYDGTPMGTAFETVMSNNPDPTYVNGFLQDSYEDTDSLAQYNQAASTIDQQYAQNISDTQNDIEQLEDIRQQVDTIVAYAKAQYIQQQAKAGTPVNLTCLNNAYQIDTDSIEGTPRQEPDDANPLHAEEDAMVAHSAAASSDFYTNEIK